MLATVEAAFFDLDKTVIAKASMVAFGRPLYDAGMISRWLVVRALWSNLLFHYLGADEEQMRKFKESALRVTRGWEHAKVVGVVREAITEVIEPIVYDEALELIREHRAAGRRVFIVSASPEEIVAPLAQYLGVDEAIASRARLDEEGRYTGEVEFWSYGPYKAEAIRDAADRWGIDLARSYAYSDSATDIPMLELVGNPVAVNPDRELARIAREREWAVREFAQGVPLRERVAMPPPRRAALVMGGVAVAGTGAAVGWWWLRGRTPPPPTNLERARQALEAAGSRVPRPGRTPTPPSPWDPAALASRLIDPRAVTRPAASSPRRQRGRGRRGAR